MNHIFEAGFAVLRIEITYDLHQSVLGVWVCVCVGGGGGGERPDRAKMSRIRKSIVAAKVNE